MDGSLLGSFLRLSICYSTEPDQQAHGYSTDPRRESHTITHEVFLDGPHEFHHVADSEVWTFVPRMMVMPLLEGRGSAARTFLAAGLDGVTSATTSVSSD